MFHTLEQRTAHAPTQCASWSKQSTTIGKQIPDLANDKEDVIYKAYMGLVSTGWKLMKREMGGDYEKLVKEIAELTTTLTGHGADMSNEEIAAAANHGLKGSGWKLVEDDGEDTRPAEGVGITRVQSPSCSKVARWLIARLDDPAEATSKANKATVMYS